MARVKYMGTSHIRAFEAGETWGNRLATPLASDIEFNLANGHIVDTNEQEIPDEVVELILEDPEFVDVSNHSVAPTGAAEQLYYGKAASAGRYVEGYTPEAPAGDGEGEDAAAAASTKAPNTSDAAIVPHNPIETQNDPGVDANAVAQSAAKAKAASKER